MIEPIFGYFIIKDGVKNTLLIDGKGIGVDSSKRIFDGKKVLFD
jgi:hypothetical protein